MGYLNRARGRGGPTIEWSVGVVMASLSFLVSCGMSSSDGAAPSRPVPGGGGAPSIDAASNGGSPSAGGSRGGGGSAGDNGSRGGGGAPPGSGGSSGAAGQEHVDAAADNQVPRSDARIEDSGLDASAFPNVFFDDFSYANSSDSTLTQFGWTLKSGTGTPGLPGATWSTNNVSFITDSAGDGGGSSSVGDGAAPRSNNRLMRLAASTQGATISQAEICHQFVLLEGTYAARVRFVDGAFSGASTDQVVQTFFMISAPSTRDMGNARYSECDLEYLPNGGWGSPSGLWAVSWDSYDYTDGQDIRNNQSLLTPGSRQGWHTLNIVVMNGNVVYTIDGASVTTHGGVYYPDSPMAICFNLWFAGIADAGTQSWVEDVDWVLHVKGETLSATDSERRVAALRDSQFTHLNTIR
jgi:hypothetical protein